MKRVAPELSELIVWTEPKNALDQNLKSYKTYRLRVNNIGSDLIRDCQVRLIDMININNEPTREDGVVFKLKNDNPQQIPYIQSFNISPGDFVDIELISFHEAQPRDHIRMRYAT